MPSRPKRRRAASRPLAYRGLSEKIYTDAHLERIGQAIGLELTAINRHADLFEAAAFRFLTWGSAFEERTPTDLLRKLKSIARAAQALLKQLGIEDPATAVDGPADRELFDVLSFTKGASDDIVVDACGHIGRLAEIVQAIDASQVLKQIAEQAVLERTALARLTGSAGNSGDIPVNEWIVDLLAIYKRITGKDPGTSVGATGRPNERKAAGPVIRFLEASAFPVNHWIKKHRPDIKQAELQKISIPTSGEALRQRVRAIRRSMSNP